MHVFLFTFSFSGRGELQGKSRSPSAVTGGFRVKGSRGLGLRIADLIQVDVGISRTGMKQVGIGMLLAAERYRLCLLVVSQLFFNVGNRYERPRWVRLHGPEWKREAVLSRKLGM